MVVVVVDYGCHSAQVVLRDFTQEVQFHIQQLGVTGILGGGGGGALWWWW